jgi:hypothetical protein
MRAFTLSANSWHNRLATTYGFLSWHNLKRGGTDICTYVRSILLGALAVPVLTMTVATIGAAIQDALIWAYFRFWLGAMICPVILQMS